MAIVHQRGFRPHLLRESPWYWPLAPLLARLDAAGRFPTPDELSALHHEWVEGRDLPALRFVSSIKTRKKRPRGAHVQLDALYEGRILEHGEVPTRVDDWHDFFNALSFITFPRAKRALHARQFAIMRARLVPGATRMPNARTREQDALSLFDEGGVCVVASPGLALPELDDAGVGAALSRGDVRVVPFGHALYEHLVAELPCPLATAQLVTFAHAGLSDAQLLDRVDQELAAALADPALFQLPSGARGLSLTQLA